MKPRCQASLVWSSCRSWDQVSRFYSALRSGAVCIPTYQIPVDLLEVLDRVITQAEHQHHVELFSVFQANDSFTFKRWKQSELHELQPQHVNTQIQQMYISTPCTP